MAVGGSGSRVVIVSNRGPVIYTRDASSGERTHSRGAGGLVTALNAVARRRPEAVWIASAQSPEDREVARKAGGTPVEVEELKVTLVEHDEAAYDLMYNHLANPLLWFVQHSLYNLPYSPNLGDDTRRAWREGYLPVNEGLAEAVARSLQTEGGGSDATILIHDYQLYAVPRYLRERLGDAPFVSLFVHIPWPEPEGWRALPGYVRRGVLESLLQADIVAFHTHRYARNFVRTAGEEVPEAEVDEKEGVIRHQGRETHARAYPISIDPAEFEELARTQKVLEEEGPVRRLPGRLLLRVDRMDLSKNIVRGFTAYGRMLERHPEWKERVTFLALLQPSRGGVPEYAEYAEAIRETVREVNVRYATAGWQPIVLHTEDNFPRSVAAYKSYDVLLVNPVRDGMNLVAKEAAVANQKDGVLVLSENAGAHEELGEHALTINPFDLDENADALHEALTMPDAERARRARALKETVLSNTVEDWVEAQLRDIAELRGRRV